MATSIVDQAYEVHRERLFGQLLAVTRDAAWAEDVLHESYMRLLREVHAGRAPRNPRAWLYRVGHNLIVSRARRQQVAARFVEQLPPPQVLPSAEEHVVEREASSELESVLDELDWVDRTALLMVADGYSGAEIARVVGKSESAVRTRLCRARSRVRLRLVNAALQPAADSGRGGAGR